MNNFEHNEENNFPYFKIENPLPYPATRNSILIATSDFDLPPRPDLLAWKDINDLLGIKELVIELNNNDNPTLATFKIKKYEDTDYTIIGSFGVNTEENEEKLNLIDYVNYSFNYNTTTHTLTINGIDKDETQTQLFTLAINTYAEFEIALNRILTLENFKNFVNPFIEKLNELAEPDQVLSKGSDGISLEWKSSGLAITNITMVKEDNLVKFYKIVGTSPTLIGQIDDVELAQVLENKSNIEEIKEILESDTTINYVLTKGSDGDYKWARNDLTKNVVEDDDLQEITLTYKGVTLITFNTPTKLWCDTIYNAILNNRTDIVDIKVRLSNAETTITQHTTKLTNHETRIATNETNITNLTTRMTSAENQIEVNRQNINTNIANISQLQTNLSAETTRATTEENKKLDKVQTTTTNAQVYEKNASGNQTMIDITYTNGGNTLCMRNANGNIQVGEATNDNDATSKEYVDNISNLKLDKITTTGSRRVYTIEDNGIQDVNVISENLVSNSIPIRDDDGNIKVADEPTNNNDAISKIYLEEQFFDKIYPVGSIYVSVNASAPFERGTWVSFGSGKCLVGVDTTQTEFNTVEKTGGEKTHTLTTQEMPSHNHTEEYAGTHDHTNQIYWQNRYYPLGDNSYGLTQTTGMRTTAGGIVTCYTTPTTSNGSHKHTINNTGNDNAHNNLQPYITCYFFKRTA